MPELLICCLATVPPRDSLMDAQRSDTDAAMPLPMRHRRASRVPGAVSGRGTRGFVRKERKSLRYLGGVVLPNGGGESGQRGRSDYRSSSGGGTWMSGLRMRWEAFPEVEGYLALQEVVLECKGGGDLAVITGDVHSTLVDFFKSRESRGGDGVVGPVRVGRWMGLGEGGGKLRW
ncbi:hypothetical protein GWK47_021047 [Chionoecetes opilio]|uniref:Uncharacterized protein n=1 Tax=Chionoecetes opilio TaxID=41210 RepID=A0A8J5CI40_CHIOP|nr:hypothetical protein GWK47_021047 [Chionoecetes opilio]